MEVSSEFDVPADLLQRKRLLVAIEYQAVWAPEPFWHFWKEEKSYAGNRTRIVQLAALSLID